MPEESAASLKLTAEELGILIEAMASVHWALYEDKSRGERAEKLLGRLREM